MASDILLQKNQEAEEEAEHENDTDVIHVRCLQPFCLSSY